MVSFGFCCIKLMVNFFPKLLQFNLFDKDGITFYDWLCRVVMWWTIIYPKVFSIPRLFDQLKCLFIWPSCISTDWTNAGVSIINLVLIAFFQNGRYQISDSVHGKCGSKHGRQTRTARIPRKATGRTSEKRLNQHWQKNQNVGPLERHCKYTLSLKKDEYIQGGLLVVGQ